VPHIDGPHLSGALSLITKPCFITVLEDFLRTDFSTLMNTVKTALVKEQSSGSSLLHHTTTSQYSITSDHFPPIMDARGSSEAAADTAMASLESEFESCIDIVSVDGYSVDQIVQHIVNAHRDGTESIISLHWPADAAWDLGVRIDEKLVKLDQIKIQRFEYDYQSGIAYIDIMPETSLHFQMLVGTHNHIEISLARFIGTISDAALRQRIVREILDFGTASIYKEQKILKQGDFAFGTFKNKFPSLVGEVS
jgi:hypothetical protein